MEIPLGYGAIVNRHHRRHRGGKDRDGGAAAERLRGRTSGQVQPHAAGRLSYPHAVRRADRLPAQPQGDRDRHRRADLHHPRQRAGGRRCGAVHAGARSASGLLRHHQLRLRHLAARADHAAQRDRQDRTRPHLRGARQHQHQRGQRTGQGLGALGRQGAALRNQEHHAAEGRAVGDGEADARGARKARRRPHLRGRARRQDQRGRGRQAAGDQAVRGQQAAADQRGRGPGAGDPRGGDARPPRACARSASRCPIAAASRPCSCASARST